MSRVSSFPRIAGFTLVELLVALFITAIIFAMGYGAMNQALVNREMVKVQQERLLAVQTAVRVLTQDFTQLAPRPVRDSLGDSYQPAILAQEDAEMLVVFTRAGWANPAGIQRSTFQRVAYEFTDNTLRRIHWPVLDATLTDQTVRRDLLTNVKSVRFRFMDSGRQWYERWPTQSTTTPQGSQADRRRPIAVEVTLELEDWGEIVRIIEVAT